MKHNETPRVVRKSKAYQTPVGYYGYDHVFGRRVYRRSAWTNTHFHATMDGNPFINVPNTFPPDLHNSTEFHPYCYSVYRIIATHDYPLSLDQIVHMHTITFDADVNYCVEQPLLRHTTMVSMFVQWMGSLDRDTASVVLEYMNPREQVVEALTELESVHMLVKRHPDTNRYIDMGVDFAYSLMDWRIPRATRS